MAEEGTGGRERGERGGRRKGPERDGDGRKREGPHDTLAWGPQCLNPALDIAFPKTARSKIQWFRNKWLISVALHGFFEVR